MSLQESLGKDVKDRTLGYVIRELLNQAGSSWKCGTESLLTYRDRVYDAQAQLEHVLCAPFEVLYPKRFQMSSLKKKYAALPRVEECAEAPELCGGI